MSQSINLETVMGALLQASNVREICTGMLLVKKRKLEDWDAEIKKKYPEGDPFPGVRSGLETDIALLKGIIGGLS
jgi:hypothetical protein